MTEARRLLATLLCLEWTRLLADATSVTLLTHTLSLEPFLTRSNELAAATTRARRFRRTPWAFILTARTDEALLAFALGHTILQIALALTSASDLLVLGARGVTASPKVTSLALTCSATLTHQAPPMPIACHLATC